MSVNLPFIGSRIRATGGKFLYSHDGKNVILNIYMPGEQGQLWESEQVLEEKKAFLIKHPKSGAYLGWKTEDDDVQDMTKYKLVVEDKKGVEFIWTTDGKYIYHPESERIFGKPLVLVGDKVAEIPGVFSPVCISKYKYLSVDYPFNPREIEVSVDDGGTWVSCDISRIDMREKSEILPADKFSDNAIEYVSGPYSYYCTPVEKLGYGTCERLWLRKSDVAPAICLHKMSAGLLKDSGRSYVVAACDETSRIVFTFAPADDCNDPSRSIPLPGQITDAQVRMQEEKKQNENMKYLKILLILVVIILILYWYEGRGRRWWKSVQELDYKDIEST